MICFRSWFAGFVDGEGSFLIVKAKSKARNTIYVPMMCLTLRKDDTDILVKIQNDLQLGTLNFFKKNKPTHHDVCRLRVSGIKQCRKLVEFFDQYPPQSKKSKDYEVWRTFVLQKAEHRTKLPKSLCEYYYLRLKEVRKYKDVVTTYPINTYGKISL